MLHLQQPFVAGLAIFAVCIFTTSAMGDIVTKDIEYKLPNGETARGMAVYDDAAEGKRPGVLVIPEWWGLNEYPQMRARQLAEMGYVAFVADMYGKRQVTREAGQAQELATKAYQVGLAKLAKPALEQLRKLPQVDGTRIAAIGFCFGGSTVADMIKSGLDFQAGVSFHGGLGPDAAPAKGSPVKTAMMVLHGGADPMVPPAQVGGYVQKCIEAGVPISVVNFPQAVHAFSNPDADRAKIDGVKYDQAAAEASWKIMQHFLGMVLGDGDEVTRLHGMRYDGAEGPED